MTSQTPAFFLCSAKLCQQSTFKASSFISYWLMKPFTICFPHSTETIFFIIITDFQKSSGEHQLSFLTQFEHPLYPLLFSIYYLSIIYLSVYLSIIFLSIHPSSLVFQNNALFCFLSQICSVSFISHLWKDNEYLPEISPSYVAALFQGPQDCPQSQQCGEKTPRTRPNCYTHSCGVL